MKIAMLTNNYKPFLGGVPISVERQAKELVKLGHEVTVFAPEYDGELPEGTDHFDENGIRIFRYKTSSKCMENGMVYPRMVLKEITDVFKNETFDLIHTHHPMFVGMTALYLGRRYQLPVVYTYHTRYEDYLHYIGFLNPEGTGRYWKNQLLKVGKNVVVPEFMRWFTNQCDLVLAPTAGMQKRIRENGTRTSMAVFPTGLETSFYEEHPAEAKKIRREYLGNRDGYLFCTAGRLEEEKNPHFFLKGIKRLKEKMNGTFFKVLMIGNGSMTEALKKEAKELGIEEEIIFAGKVPNEILNQYLQACDAFLFTSKSETQGIVLAEAFAAGLPIVAVEASGVEDIVENGMNGFRTAEDAEIWTDQILAMLKQREKMSERAKVTAAGYRSTQLAAYEEMLYRQCIAAKENEASWRYEEDVDYEYQKDRAEHTSGGIFRIFKTS